MPVYLVAYDIKANYSYDRSRPVPKEETERVHVRREEFRKNLFESYPTPHKLSESAYMIESPKNVLSVAGDLRRWVAKWDELYVTSLEEPLHGQGELLEPETQTTLRAWLALRS